ncbi:MAG: FeoB-associated Cys-rich membrane protein [Clostridium sp.]|nr:FeoB-associated Cys-rich membrane protein [Clostridium sp.]
MGNVIVGVLLIAAVALVVRSMVRDKKNGKSLQCGCDCSHCGGHCTKGKNS